ncbi:MAG: hypothetical protein AAF126_06540 [Chloroflexota bacterium]
MRLLKWIPIFLLATLLVSVASAQETTSDTQTILETIPACHDALIGATVLDANGCATAFDPYETLVFFDDDDAGWFNRFWTGSCSQARGFCVGGIGWTETIDILTERLPDEYDAYATNRLWAFGRASGFNWSHGNDDIKEISTNDVRVWGNRLDRATEIDAIFDELASIESEICERTAPDFFVAGYARGDGCLSHAEMMACDVMLVGTSEADENGCATLIEPVDTLDLDEAQAEAFMQFWTGACGDADCAFGEGWQSMMDAQLALIQSEYIGQMRQRWWALGRAMGEGWATGLVTADTVRDWTTQIADATNEYDLRAITATVEDAVCVQLGADAIEHYALGDACAS